MDYILYYHLQMNLLNKYYIKQFKNNITELSI